MSENPQPPPFPYRCAFCGEYSGGGVMGGVDDQRTYICPARIRLCGEIMENQRRHPER